MFLTRLLLLIKPSVIIETQERYGVNEIFQEEKAAVQNEAECSKMRHFIINVLRDWEALLIMDNTEDPLEADNEGFKHELSEILENC